MTTTVIRHIIGVLVVALLVSAAPGLGTTTATNHTLQITPAVDVPDRTTTFEGTEYRVTAIGRVTPGAEFDVAVSAPDETKFNVHLYNGEKQIVDSTRGTGDASLTFPTDGLEPGSYTIVIEQDGQFEAIHPVVISGYRVEIEAPMAVPVSEDLPVAVSLTSLDDGSIDRVEVVIADSDGETRVTLEATGDQSYEGTVSSASLTAGSYRVYAVVRGTDTVDGTNELLGVSDAQDLDVESAPTTTPTTTNDDGGASGSGSDTTTTPTVTTTDTATTTVTITPTITSTTSTGTDAGNSDSDLGEGTLTTEQRTPTTETTSSNVITPNETTASTTGTSATAGLSFGLFRAVAFSVFCLFLIRIWRS